MTGCGDGDLVAPVHAPGRLVPSIVKDKEGLVVMGCLYHGRGELVVWSVVSGVLVGGGHHEWRCKGGCERGTLLNMIWRWAWSREEPLMVPGAQAWVSNGVSSPCNRIPFELTGDRISI